MCGVAYLIKKTFTTDAVRNQIPTEERQEIFVDEMSVSRQEWADAGRQGLNPAILLRTHRLNYSGEDEVEYNGIRYGIYRTYCYDETVELYLQKKGGLE